MCISEPRQCFQLLSDVYDFEFLNVATVFILLPSVSGVVSLKTGANPFLVSYKQIILTVLFLINGFDNSSF